MASLSYRFFSNLCRSGAVVNQDILILVADHQVHPRQDTLCAELRQRGLLDFRS